MVLEVGSRTRFGWVKEKLRSHTQVSKKTWNVLPSLSYTRFTLPQDKRIELGSYWNSRRSTLLVFLIFRESVRKNLDRKKVDSETPTSPSSLKFQNEWPLPTRNVDVPIYFYRDDFVAVLCPPHFGILLIHEMLLCIPSKHKLLLRRTTEILFKMTRIE